MATTKNGLGQRVGDPVDRDRALAHRLEQRRLHLRARAVDLVGEHHVGEDRPGLEHEAAVLGAAAQLGQRAAEQVARQQVAGELDAAEARVDRARERVGERGLADARDVLEQQVAARDQGLDRAPHHLGLAAQRALDVRAQPRGQAGGLAHREPGEVVRRASALLGAAGCTQPFSAVRAARMRRARAAPASRRERARPRARRVQERAARDLGARASSGGAAVQARHEAARGRRPSGARAPRAYAAGRPA